MLFTSWKDWPTVRGQVRASSMGVRRSNPSFLELINIKNMFLQDKTCHRKI